MTKRICQVCGKHKHIDTMTKVGNRYACDGLMTSCVKKAKADIKMQQMIQSPKTGTSIPKMIVYFLGFVISVNMVFAALTNFLQSLGVSFTTADDVSLLPAIIAVSAAVIMYKKHQNKEE